MFNLFLISDQNEDRLKFMINLTFLVCINIFVHITVRIKTTKAISTVCLSRKSFASVGGKWRRNVFTFQEIMICHRFNIFAYTLPILLFILVDFKIIQTPRTVMLLWSSVLLLRIFMKGTLLPWKIILSEGGYHYLWTEPQKRKNTIYVYRKNAPFYVREPDMIPRI